MRLIDADAFEKFIRKNCADSLVDLWCELVRRQPTIEAVEVKHGEWIPHTNASVQCSACDGVVLMRFNFCPHCGADMRKDGAE